MEKTGFILFVSRNLIIIVATYIYLPSLCKAAWGFHQYWPAFGTYTCFKISVLCKDSCSRQGEGWIGFY